MILEKRCTKDVWNVFGRYKKVAGKQLLSRNFFLLPIALFGLCVAPAWHLHGL